MGVKCVIMVYFDAHTGDLEKLDKNRYFSTHYLHFLHQLLYFFLCMAGKLGMSRLFWHQYIQVTLYQPSAISPVLLARCLPTHRYQYALGGLAKDRPFPVAAETLLDRVFAGILKGCMGCVCIAGSFVMSQT